MTKLQPKPYAAIKGMSKDIRRFRRVCYRAIKDSRRRGYFSNQGIIDMLKYEVTSKGNLSKGKI